MFFKQNIKYYILFRLTLMAFFVAIIVVLLGAFTRLVDAGLGCPDWPGCYGYLLWPDEIHEIIKAEAAFPDAPLQIDKTWPEMVHRYLAAALGLLVFSIVVFSVITVVKRNYLLSNDCEEKIPLKLSLFLFVLVVLQAVFGMWTVTLKLWPQVVTAHLLGGFSTLSLLWLLNQRLGGERWLLFPNQYQKLQKIKPLLIISFIVLIMQIALGGWVSSNYAGLACPDIPQCLGEWWPTMDMATGFSLSQGAGPNYLGGKLNSDSRIAIHFMHRIGAIILLIILILSSFFLWRVGALAIKRWAALLCFFILLQVLLGIGNIIWALSLAISLAHNAVAGLLLLVMISICHRTFSGLLVMDKK